jgi:hypothetical protein
MKIYLASRYDRRPEMESYAILLQGLGYEISSRWVWGQHDLPPGGELELKHEEAKTRIAKEDFRDVLMADVLIFFAEEPPSPPRGARHVEFGIALAANIDIMVVGPKENIFHWMPGVEHYGEFSHLLEPLAEFKAHIDVDSELRAA